MMVGRATLYQRF